MWLLKWNGALSHWRTVQEYSLKTAKGIVGTSKYVKNTDVCGVVIGRRSEFESAIYYLVKLAFSMLTSLFIQE